MLDGFVRVAAVTPEVRVADCLFNADRIDEATRAAADKGAKIIVFPELSVTGYTCGDLFLQDTLLDAAKRSLLRLVRASGGIDAVIVVGLPLVFGGKLYNVAAVYSDGELLGFVPKTHIPNYGEFYELRHFTPAGAENAYLSVSLPETDDADEDDDEDDDDRPDKPYALNITEFLRTGRFPGENDFDDEDELEIEFDVDDDDDYEDVPFGTNLLFRCEERPELAFAAEICEDLWAPDPPSVHHALSGALIIVNLSAGNETIGKAAYRRLLTGSQSGRLVCGYIYANAGFGESSTDMVFSGHSLISENGVLLAEAKPFAQTSDRAQIVIADIDIKGLQRDRRYLSSYKQTAPGDSEYEEIVFSLDFDDEPEYERGGKVIPFALDKRSGTEPKQTLYRYVAPHPFVPSDPAKRAGLCEEILNMQSSGLARRIMHTDAESAVVGISGGLDSTLALIVTARAMRLTGRPPESIVAVTMPGFGTTDQTKDNAHKLCRALGIPLREIDITASVTEHLKAIDHELTEHDVVFENAQARIRTLVLMDLANKTRGLVVGTGDLSELALGWATFNGDHMSMYGVNAGVPKSLVRHIIKYAADTASGDTAADLSGVLLDIIDTPVSPELLPPDDDGITQKTEEIIGPYELHDFFLYHMLRWGRRPSLILELAKIAFKDQGKQDHNDDVSDKSYHGKGAYTDDEILHWLKLFYQRFFRSQFKRSTLPDGPKIGSVTLSPRGDWRMPSDAEVSEWLRDLE
ncbi:MAG: NAD(+) synthase [Clostridiales Family XIII bacterium]|jgi:NAD+ synthase (glutamine-hydrolysing)|nr:NAD(+) synthase [Clostridiales Family XIII bacterium]